MEILQRSAAFPAEDLLDDSSFPSKHQPLPPIVEPQMPMPMPTTMMTTTEATEETKTTTTTTTTMATTIMSAESEEMLQEQVISGTEIILVYIEMFKTCNII